MSPQEYNILVAEYANRLCRFADKMLRDRDQAKDVVQDTLAKLWVQKEKIQIEKIKSWLFTVTYRSCLEVIAKKNKIVYDYDFDTISELPASNDLKEVLAHSLEILTEIQKSVLLLRDYEGYSYDEIAEIMQLSLPQVKVYLFRARSKMKDYLKDIHLVF